jgi:riboflavin kinase/FMN adenylyltransferase
VEQVGGVSSSAGIISSTSIRDALINGRIEDANRWLGYDYSVRGKVVQGRRLGRSLGFPTANIRPEDPYKLIPADGVYAVEVLLGNEKVPGMMSIGFNPTVNKKLIHKSIEVNIFDIDRDLYGHTVTVIFKFWLRNEKRFDSMELLAEQMKLDRESAIRLLG